MAETHYIKAWPVFYRPLARGEKTFEVRKDDRAYQTGDTLIIAEFDPANIGGEYSGQSVTKVVTFVLRGGQFGIEPGFVVMGLATPPVSEPKGE